MSRCVPQKSAKNVSKATGNHSVDDDSIEDDDGGLKPESISTMSKIIPTKQPELNAQESSTSKSKANRTIKLSEDEDEDGGPDAKKIDQRRRKQGEAKKKQKQTPTVPLRISDDEDGTMSTNKPKPDKSAGKKLAKKEGQLKSKLSSCIFVQSADDDAAPQQGSGADPKKNDTQAKKKLTPSFAISDDDEDGVSKRSQPVTKKATKPVSTKNSNSKPKVPDNDEDEDEDGSFVTRSEKTVQKLNPSKQPSADKPSAKKETPATTINSNPTQSNKTPQKENPLIANRSDQTVPVKNQSIDAEKPKKKTDQEPVPPKKEATISPTITIKAPPAEPRVMQATPTIRLRTNSYCEAQQTSLSIVSSSSTSSSCSVQSESSASDESSHSPQWSTDEHSPTRLNSQPTGKPIEFISDQSMKQAPSDGKREKRLTSKRTEDIERQIRARTRWDVGYTVITESHLSASEQKPSQQPSQPEVLVSASNPTEPKTSPSANSQNPPTPRSVPLSSSRPPPGGVNRLLSLPLATTYPLSSAEQYVAWQSALVCCDPRSGRKKHAVTSVSEGSSPVSPPPPGSKDAVPTFFSVSDPTGYCLVLTSPKSPTSTNLELVSNQSTAGSSTNQSVLIRQLSHDQRMYTYYRARSTKLLKKRSHRYQYGTMLRPSLIDRLPIVIVPYPAMSLSRPSPTSSSSSGKASS